MDWSWMSKSKWMDIYLSGWISFKFLFFFMYFDRRLTKQSYWTSIHIFFFRWNNICRDIYLNIRYLFCKWNHQVKIRPVVIAILVHIGNQLQYFEIFLHVSKYLSGRLLLFQPISVANRNTGWRMKTETKNKQ